MPTNCVQVNAPEINQEQDPCNGTHSSTQCTIHPDALAYLAITPNTPLYDILVAINASLLDKENRIATLEEQVASLLV